MINTQELTNYITFMESGKRKRKSTNIHYDMIQEALTTLENDLYNVPYNVMDEFIKNNLEGYMKRKENLENHPLTPNETRLHNSAIYSIIIYITNEYLDCGTDLDFRSFLG